MRLAILTTNRLVVSPRKQDNLKLVDTDMPGELGEGQLLLRATYISVDPYMRGRMKKSEGYMKGTNDHRQEARALTVYVSTHTHTQAFLLALH